MKTKYLIPLALFSIILAGCEKPIQENCGCLPATTTVHREFYQLTVNGVSKDICPDAPKSGAYVEGTKFSFKILCVTDVTFYPYLDDLRIKPTKDSYELGQYSYYSFEMPNHDATLTITGNQFFYEKEYSISQISGFSINADAVNKVSLEKGYLGVDPATANPTITYSEDREDIAHNVAVITNPYMVKTDERMPEGGRYVKVTFYCNNGLEKSITIENDLYVYRDFANYTIFTFQNLAPRFEIKHPMTGDNR